MDTERWFRRSFVAVLIPFVAIRVASLLVVSRRRAKPRARQRASISGLKRRWAALTTYEDRLSVATRVALGPLIILSVWRYLAAPQRVQRYALPIPGWLRWAGAALGFASLPLLAWTHQTLGRAWSPNLELQDQHRLVIDGPYRWVRHPMYTAFLMFFAGSALTTANSVIIGPAGVASWVILRRIAAEESMMTARFGDDYRIYTERTGRLLPRTDFSAVLRRDG
ncbi:MAG: hypothetical protein OHK0015_12560 [Chloroflexi bacterium OHK40]